MFRFKKVIPYFLFIACGITFYSCKYDKAENQPCNGTTPDTVSFSADVLPIFRASCSISGCHTSASNAGHLNLEDSQAYTELSHQGSGYINLTTPTHSILYSQMNSSSQPMPPTGKLDDCKINLILKWIQQGAKNN